jgi:hypothetical protein
MSGKWKFMLAAAIVTATISAASTASATHARCRLLAAGPEWYLDDLGCWHSIRSDWAGIQRHVRARRRGLAPYEGGSSDR